MRKSGALLATVAMLVGGLTVGAAPASAGTTWDFASASFPVSDGFGATGTISVSNFKVVDGTAVSGRVGFSWDRYSCSSTRSGMTATFVPSGGPAPEPCTGTVTFAIDGSGVLSASSSLTVTSRFFSGSSSSTAQGVAPAPTLTAISPNTVQEMGGGTATITGADLAGASAVSVGQQQASIVAATDTSVIITLPSAGLNPTGTAVDVTVTTPAGTANLPASFTYTSNPPSVSAVTPSCGVTAGATLTINGYRFANATAVTIGGQSVPFTVASGTGIASAITTTAPALAGVQSVVVTTAAGSSSGLATVSYNACSPLPKLTLAVTSTTPAGGFATIAWSFPANDPNLGNVQGLQYALAAGGPYTNVGGTQSGTSGSFTVSGLAKSSVLVYVKTVNANPALGKDTLTVVGVRFATTPTPLPPNTGNAGSVPPPAPATSPAAGGTGGGGGSGSAGSGGSGSGDSAAVTAPCLAPVGSLYPVAFGTVGSQLVVVPGRPGEESPTAVTVKDGALPPGLGLDAMTGIAYGVPTAAGRFSATVAGRYADGRAATGTLDITIDNDPQTISYPVLVLGSVGQTVTTGPTTNAPVGSTYEIVCGKVPPGTRFEPKTGVIAGTPTTVDEENPPLRIVERNALGSAATSFIFIVAPSGTAQLSYPGHPHLVVRKATRIRPTVVDAGAILYFKVLRGKLNRGLRLNHTTGVITGKPAMRTGRRSHAVTVAGVRADGTLVLAAPMQITVRARR